MTYDRPMWPPGAEITAQGFEAFGLWRSKRDPNLEVDILDLVEEYAALHDGESAGDATVGQSTGSENRK